MSNRDPNAKLTKLSRVTEGNRRRNRGIPISDNEWAAYTRAAGRAGKPVTTWIRDTANASATPPPSLAWPGQGVVEDRGSKGVPAPTPEPARVEGVEGVETALTFAEHTEQLPPDQS